MNFTDPFYGYSFVVRFIVYVLIPAFGLWQFVRLRRALHVFQLEGYKRRRFLEWCRRDRKRALFLSPMPQKKPLVMTGRAWRISITATVLSVALVLGVSGLVHVYLGGWPLDVATWIAITGVVFAGAPHILVFSDWLLSPAQAAINGRYMRAARRRLGRIDPVVIAVTGSFGKTSTKFAIAKLVGEDVEVLATPDSYNTPLGVCRAINEWLRPEHRYFVVEMGAYREGDIAELCRFVDPTVGVLTAIGPAHLERFGSVDAIRRAKYEVVTSLPPDGIAVMNVDDPEVRALADSTRHVGLIRYGLDPGGRPRITARDVETTPDGTRLVIRDAGSGRSISGSVPLLGRHAVGHVLAAAAVAVATGAALEEAEPRLGSLRPVEHRLQLLDGAGGITIIDDAYNSNPDGAAAALEVLEQMPGDPKVVVTPGMVELGELQFEENRRLGRRAGAVADHVIVVALPNRDALVAGASEGNARVVTVGSLSEAEGHLRRILRPGAVVLFENDLPDQYEG